MKSQNETAVFDQSVKPRRPKSREVSSRFLSSHSPTSSTSSLEIGNSSPGHGISPSRRKSASSVTETRNNRTGQLDDSGLRSLWPSMTSSTSSSSSSKKLDVTLADHLGNERLNDLLDRKNSVFDRQRSYRENDKEIVKEITKESAKENHRPIIGGSMRYTGKSRYPGKSPPSSSSSKLFNKSNIVPGRFSVDENALYQKSNRRMSDSFTSTLDYYSGSEYTDTGSGNDFISKSTPRKASGVEVSSRYMNDVSTRQRRWTSDSNISNPVSLDSSPRLGKLSIKNVIKRANSITGYGSAKSQWALSPGRSGSPPMSVENIGSKPVSFSSLKPPNSPSRTKGVEKLLNLGFDLFKSRKSSSSSSSSSNSSLVGNSISESGHQLRLLHNRLMQWRYANARADFVNSNVANHVESNLVYAWEGLKKLQSSVVQKRIQLEKEKLDLKLNFILQSQFKLMEAWGDMERQHSAAISKTKESLHSVVCRIPLIEGAKVDIQSASMALRHASDLTSSIKMMLTSFSLSGEKNVSLMSELAEVVAQERLLLQECLELFRTISVLEIEERSLKSSIIQMESCQQQQKQQQHQPQEEISNSS
ncbi:hypothetical protein UlMin_014355 [Ulmus minor]